MPMFLSIHFVDGFTPEGWGGSAAHFEVDGIDGVSECAGICCNGTYKRYPSRRFCTIYVVRQPVLWATIRVLVHELGHAAAWLLRLPPKWSKAIDG